MIHEIAPHKYDVSYQDIMLTEWDTLIICQNGGLLCSEVDGQTAYPLAGEAAEVFPDIYKKAVFLFRIDEVNYFGIWETEAAAFGKFTYLPKDKLRNKKPFWKAYAGITGYQILKWYAENRFCGRCGQKMQRHGRERAMVCPDCGFISYPRINPSVIAGVINGNSILLTKYSESHSRFQKYALVAGYTEIGESLEDTVRREVMEETGLRVKNIRYYKSQPWPFTDTLLAGFFCEVDGSAEIRMDREELSAAEWFERDRIPAERSEAGISLTGEMIEAFLNGQEGCF